MTSSLPTKPREIVDRSLERRMDLVAHGMRMVIGIALLTVAWATGAAEGQQTAFTLFILGVYLPLSPVDYLLTPRFAGRTWFDGAIAAGHTMSVFAIAWLVPSLQVVSMLGYLVIVVVFTMNGGRLMGLVVTVIAAPLAVAANLLAPPDDQVVWAVVAMFPVACVFLTVLVHGVTAERALKTRELEAALAAERHARRRAETAKAAKDRFVESVTHELRTPLAVLKGALALLGSDRQIDAATRRDLTAKAASRADDLDRLVAQVVDYSNVESTLENAPTHHEVAGAIARAVGAADLTDRNITVDGDDQVHVWAATGVLERVIGLVLDNAAKFSEPGSAIEITTTTERDHVVVTIRDHGRGIEADELDSVFEPFRQSGELLPGTMGIGIGLTLARQLCEHHEGSISLQSELGAGSTAVIRLPRSHRSGERRASAGRST